MAKAVNKTNFKKRPVTVGLMLWIFSGIVTTIISVGGAILADLKSDIAEEGKARKEWVKEEFKPHITKFDVHVKDFHKVGKDVGIVLDRTNSLANRTESMGETHNIVTEPPTD